MNVFASSAGTVAQWLLVGVGAALLLASVCSLILHWAAKRQRNFSFVLLFTAVVLLFMGAANGLVPAIRTTVVVFEAAPSDRILDDVKDAVETAFSEDHLLSSCDRVMLVECSTNAALRDLEWREPNWHQPAQLLKQLETGGIPKSVVTKVKIPERTSVVDLLKDFQVEFGDHWWPWFQRRSVIALVDERGGGDAGRSWAGLSLPRSDEDLSDAVRNPDVSIFVSDSGSSERGRLQLRLSRESIPITAETLIKDLDGQYVTVILQDRPDIPHDARVTINTTLEGQGQKFETKPRETVPQSGMKQWTVKVPIRHLAPESPGAYNVSPGIYRLEVTMTVSNHGTETFSGVVYFEMTEQRLIVVERKPASPTNEVPKAPYFPFGLGELTALGSEPPLFSAITKIRQKAPYQAVRAAIPPVEHVEWKRISAATMDHAKFQKEILKNSKDIILVEPSLSELGKFSELCSTATGPLLIDNGLNVMIVGMPHVDDESNLPDWCKGFARPKNEKRELVCDDLRLYFSLDQSRLMMLVSDPSKLSENSGLAVQRDVVNRFYELVNARYHQEGKLELETSHAKPLHLGTKLNESDVKEQPRTLIWSSDFRMAYSEWESSPTLPVELLSICPSENLPFGAKFENLNKFGGGNPDDAIEMWGKGNEEGYLFETALGTVSMRLSSLLSQNHPHDVNGRLLPGQRRPLNHHDVHQRTAVVLFVPDGLLLPTKIEGLPEVEMSSISELQQRGVRFIVVKMKLATNIVSVLQSVGISSREFDTKLGKATFEAVDNLPHRKDESHWKVIELDCSKANDRKRVASAINDTLRSWSAPSQIKLSKHLGRTVDNRVLSSVGPVHRLNVKENAENLASETETVVSVVDSSGGESPLIESRLIGEGRLQVLHYSPVGFDTWRNDIEFPGVNPDANKLPVEFQMSNASGMQRGGTDNRSKMQGWGIQRILDFANLARVRVLPESETTVQRIRELPGRSGLIIDCWANVGADSTWPDAAIDYGPAGASKKLPGQLVRVDPLSKTVSYMFQSAENVEADGSLTFNGGKPRSLPINLLAAGEGNSVGQVLKLLASMTGGAEFRPDTVLPRHVGLGQFLFLLLPCLVLLLASPLCRSWSGVSSMLSRIWMSQSPELNKVSVKNVETAVEGILNRWGRHPGMPDALRHAGIQAGQRNFQSGDSLAVSRRASLVPLTDVGEELGLPAKRPVVRVRYANRSMDALITCDVGPNLKFPQTTGALAKKNLYLEITALLAQVVWNQTGGVSLNTLTEMNTVYGPYNSADNIGSLIGAAANAMDSPGSAAHLVLPAAVAPGQAVFLISGLTGFRDKDIADFFMECAANDIRLRIFHVVDAAESTMTGLCLNQSNGALIDRSDLLPSLLTAAYGEFSSEVEYEAERTDLRYVKAKSTDRLEQIAETLFESGFLK